MTPFAVALLVTTAAGLATGLGGLVALWPGSTRPAFLAGSLGFSVGVMVYISLVELVPRAVVLGGGVRGGGWLVLGCFALGIGVVQVVNRTLPVPRLPVRALPGGDEGAAGALLRTGLLTAVVLALHNFPEGLATFVSTMQDQRFGLAMGLAIAIHNVPEGLAVAVPVLHATRSRSRAVLWALASGVAEPAGALVAGLVLAPLLSGAVVGAVLAAIAGMMVHISFDELLPTARRYGNHPVVMRGIVAGMLVMAASLQLAG